MAYITTSQLSDRLGSTLYARLTDRVDGNSADASVAGQIIDDAEAVVNSYLARRFATPLNLTQHPEISDLIEARTLDLAEYVAWRQSPFVTDIPDRVRFLYDDATHWFRDVAEGAISLPASSPPESATAADDGPRVSGSPRKFTESELDGL